MISDDPGWSLMIFRNHNFFMILTIFFKCTTWRRVLRTHLPLPEEVPQVSDSVRGVSVASFLVKLWPNKVRHHDNGFSWFSRNTDFHDLRPPDITKSTFQKQICCADAQCWKQCSWLVEQVLYCRRVIPVKSVWASRPVHNNVCWDHLLLISVLNTSIGMNSREDR